MTPLPAVSQDQVCQVLDSLPPLPPIARYWDDYEDKYRSVKDVASNDVWLIHNDGKIAECNLTGVPSDVRIFLKHAFVYLLSQQDTSSALGYLSAALSSRSSPKIVVWVRALLVLSPQSFRDEWIKYGDDNFGSTAARVLRTFVHVACDLAMGHWHQGMHSFASSLPVPKRDLYRAVRTGDCFLPVEQQSLLIDYFDELSRRASDEPRRIATDKLREACILMLIFQYAFRPGQVARIKVADVRLFNTGAVHVSVPLTKKQDTGQRRRVTRRVKRDWCPIVSEYILRRNDISNTLYVPPDSLFGLTPSEISVMIRELTSVITHYDWSATELRHTAAQRLADAGVSHMALTEFMGHSSIRTANIYFDTSPTQAQRVNQALAISPIYSQIPKIARTRTIDKNAVLRLPEDQQIGGIPHGIPIAGIGRCETGQSFCAKNPVLSCYTCRKFMPVHDAAIHEEAIDGMRPVVLEFSSASRGNERSPAFVQLRRMLVAAQRVVEDIKSGSAT